MMTDDQQKFYAKGYQAGRKRAKLDDAALVQRAFREDFVQRMMVSIAPQVIASPWGRTVKGQWVSDKGADQIMKTVRSIAEAAAKQSYFHDTSSVFAGGAPL